MHRLRMSSETKFKKHEENYTKTTITKFLKTFERAL